MKGVDRTETVLRWRRSYGEVATLGLVTWAGWAERCIEGFFQRE